MDRLRSHDQGFVGAAPDRVYRALAEPSSYPRWWAGSRVSNGALSLPVAPRGRPATPKGEREGTGLYLAFGGDSLEWYLEPFEDGTIVNAFLDLDPGSAWGRSRRLRRLRSAVRSGLVGLKRSLEAS